MKLPKIKFPKIPRIFSKRNKKIKLKDLQTQNLYKEQERLDFAKKRKPLGVRVRLSNTQINYRKIIFSIVGIIVLGIIILGIYIFTGPTFRVKFIEAIKKDSLVDINIAYKSLDNFRNKIIFDIDSTEVLQRLTSYQETIESVSVKKNLPSTLYIEIQSYKPAFNVSINNNLFLLLENGSLVPSKQINSEIKNLGIENTFGKNKFLAYKKVYDTETIKKIQEIIKQVSLNIPASIIANYYQDERELHLIFNNTTRVMFSLDDDISVEEQVKNLAILHKESNLILNGENIYIDIRVKDKAFSCSYENEGLCRYNISFLYPEIELPNIEPIETVSAVDTEI